MNHAVDALAVTITGLLVGVELGVALFFHPIVDRLSDNAYRAARGRSGAVLGAVMPFWYAFSLLLLALAAFDARGSLRGWLCAAAAGLMAAVVVATLTMLVPLNNRIARWPTSGELSRELGARWDRRHRLRVVALLAVFVLLTTAVT